MKSHPRVCVEASRFDETGYWESVIVYGDAEVVDDPNVEGEVVADLLAKYGAATESLHPTPMPALFSEQPIVVAVPIDSVTGRCSGRGLTPPSRPGRL